MFIGNDNDTPQQEGDIAALLPKELDSPLQQVELADNDELKIGKQSLISL